MEKKSLPDGSRSTSFGNAGASARDLTSGGGLHTGCALSAGLASPGDDAGRCGPVPSPEVSSRMAASSACNVCTVGRLPELMCDDGRISREPPDDACDPRVRTSSIFSEFIVPCLVKRAVQFRRSCGPAFNSAGRGPKGSPTTPATSRSNAGCSSANADLTAARAASATDAPTRPAHRAQSGQSDTSQTESRGDGFAASGAQCVLRISSMLLPLYRPMLLPLCRPSIGGSPDAGKLGTSTASPGGGNGSILSTMVVLMISLRL
mmetsp:Transcript_111296/g.321831  ORF Transcript_111296/g.321831 Transcript_111296/m.321831 type:complete len:263 (-) Transcript_111296:7-795(-)